MKFSMNWKSSSKPGKQRKFRYNAPLHVRQKLVHAHLSKPLREKYGVRSAQVRSGDKVKIIRGKWAGKEAKVEKVQLRLERVIITGVEITKKDGNKVKVPIHPSNLMMVDLDLGDKRRAKRFSDAAKRGGVTKTKVKEARKQGRETETGKRSSAGVRGADKLNEEVKTGGK